MLGRTQIIAAGSTVCLKELAAPGHIVTETFAHAVTIRVVTGVGWLEQVRERVCFTSHDCWGGEGGSREDEGGGEDAELHVGQLSDTWSGMRLGLRFIVEAVTTVGESCCLRRSDYGWQKVGDYEVHVRQYFI